ncbi:MAG TPA: lytic transglycosylase domain-containing protein [Ignavibacteriaceae bacterium]|nr:lytic transglycosylase domain-containing protein [Ignavibacteriaceae bacterium]
MKSNMIFFVSGFFLAAIIIFFIGSSENQSKQDDETTFPQGYKIISPKVPAELDFAGERVPLENFEVYERIDRELIVNTYYHSATILSIKKAKRWFPIIEPILIKNGIPVDFKYLMVAESGISNAISSAGATGFWQFMEAAALKYGLEVNNEVDERYHIEKSTEAACKYLREAYSLFGSWTVAAASYNMGIPGVTKQLGKQKTNNYYNLVLSEETSRYLARIIAIKEILNNPERYGFDIKENELYTDLPFTEVQISGSIENLADFAIEKGINYKILKTYNPWLRDSALKNISRKIYTVKIPEMGSIEVVKERN